MAMPPLRRFDLGDSGETWKLEPLLSISFFRLSPFPFFSGGRHLRVLLPPLVPPSHGEKHLQVGVRPLETGGCLVLACREKIQEKQSLLFL
jgi:hypothetical protein